MPIYNMTNLSNVAGVGDLMIYANNSVVLNGAGVLFGIMLLAFFFIMLMTLKRWDFDKALLSSSFACFILALVLNYGHLLNFIFPILFLVVLALTAFYMFMNNH